MKKKNKKAMKLLSLEMSNELALMILPFGTGYFLDEEGQPQSDSLTAAMALQHIQYLQSPYKELKNYDN